MICLMGLSSHSNSNGFMVYRVIGFCGIFSPGPSGKQMTSGFEFVVQVTLGRSDMTCPLQRGLSPLFGGKLANLRKLQC